jgi:hypothetical protein
MVPQQSYGRYPIQCHAPPFNLLENGHMYPFEAERTLEPVWGLYKIEEIQFLSETEPRPQEVQPLV